MREVEYWPLGIPQPDISLGTWSLPCACLPRTWPGVGLQAVSKPQTTKAIVNSSAERHNKGLKKQVSVPFCNWIMHPSWRREWQPTPVFLPGESRGQRSLARYSPWGCKESDMTERSTLSHFHFLSQLPNISPTYPWKIGFSLWFKRPGWDFPGGPGVRTPCCHCRGHGFDPWLGN